MTDWMSDWTMTADGIEHRGGVELRWFHDGGRVDVDDECAPAWLYEAQRMDLKPFRSEGKLFTDVVALLPVCSCDWRDRWPSYPEYHRDLYDVKLTDDGDVDDVATLAGPKRAWRQHVQYPEWELVQRLGSDSPGTVLAAVTRLRALLDVRAQAGVIAARYDEWTWDQVGRALGVSKQSARDRYLAIDPVPSRRRNANAADVATNRPD